MLSALVERERLASWFHSFTSVFADGRGVEKEGQARFFEARPRVCSHGAYLKCGLGKAEATGDFVPRMIFSPVFNGRLGGR